MHTKHLLYLLLGSLVIFTSSHPPHFIRISPKSTTCSNCVCFLRVLLSIDKSRDTKLRFALSVWPIHHRFIFIPSFNVSSTFVSRFGRSSAASQNDDLHAAAGCLLNFVPNRSRFSEYYSIRAQMCEKGKHTARADSE